MFLYQTLWRLGWRFCGWHRGGCLALGTALAISVQASKPTENAAYGVQRTANKSATVGDPISAASGAFSWEKTLFSLGGPMNLYFTIRYQTDPNVSFEMNPGDFPLGYTSAGTGVLNPWSMQPSPRLADSGGYAMTVQLEDGGQVCFTNDAAGNFTFVDIPGWSGGVNKDYQLKRLDDWFYFCDPTTGRVTMFQLSPDGGTRFYRPVYVVDRNSNRLTYSYASDRDSNPAAIADDEGRRLIFQYEDDPPAKRRLRAVSDHTGRTWTFQYETTAPDNNGRVTFRGLVGPDGQTHHFQYTPNNFAFEPGSLVGNLALLVAVQEPLGNRTFSNEYAALSLDPASAANIRCVAQSDAYGNRTEITLSYSRGNYYADIINPDGASNRFVHHGHHDLPPAAILDEAGRTMAFGRNIANNIRSVTDRLGRSTDFGYDATGRRLQAITNAAGQVLRFTYQTVEQVFQNPAAQHSFSFLFDELTRIDYPDGAFEAFAHDERGNITSRAPPAGAAWSSDYDTRGRLLSVRNPLGGTTTFTYATNGLLLAVAASDGFAQSFGYDAAFRLVAITNADGSSRHMAYDVMDRKVRNTDEQGRNTDYEYDANGRLARVTDPLGRVETYQYDLMNRLVGIVDRAGGLTTYAYDHRGRLLTQTDPTGLMFRYAYDQTGRLTNTLLGGLATSATYDAEGLPASTTDLAGATTRFEHDALGRLTNRVNAIEGRDCFHRDAQGRIITHIDPLSRATMFGYDSGGRLTGITNPAGASVAYRWNDLGRLTQIRDYGSNLWTFAYTPNGRLASMTDPLARSIHYAYDQRGRLATVTNADQSIEVRRYDAADHLTNIQYLASVTNSLSFSYDAAGRLETTDGLELGYDPASRVTNAVQHGQRTTARYNAAGLLVYVGYVDEAFGVEYTYNPTNGLLASVRDTLTGHGIAFLRDAAGRIAEVRRTNGVHDIIGYDALGRINRIQTAPHIDIQSVYDDAGQPLQTAQTVPLSLRALMDRVTGFAFDAASQIAHPNYAYDQRGRLIRAPEGEFTWDAASRLTGIQDTRLEYDGLGDLLRRTQKGQTTLFWHHPAIANRPLVVERNDAAGLRRYYVWTPAGLLLYMVDAADGHKPYYYHFDQGGNTLALTDDSGAVAAAYAYDPFGNPFGQTGSLDQPFTFVGAWGVRREGANGLYQARARYYHAPSQRFLSPEPLWPMIDQPAALNPYQYAGNNPNVFADFDGREVTLNTIHQFNPPQPAPILDGNRRPYDRMIHESNIPFLRGSNYRSTLERSYWSSAHLVILDDPPIQSPAVTQEGQIVELVAYYDWQERLCGFAYYDRQEGIYRFADMATLLKSRVVGPHIGGGEAPRKAALSLPEFMPSSVPKPGSHDFLTDPDFISNSHLDPTIGPIPDSMYHAYADTIGRL